MNTIPYTGYEVAAEWNLCVTTYAGKSIAWHVTASPKGSVEPVCESSQNTRNEGEEMANATIIVAAPAMYEALVAALPYVEMCEHDEAYKKGEVSKIVNQMRRALPAAREGGVL